MSFRNGSDLSKECKKREETNRILRREKRNKQLQNNRKEEINENQSIKQEDNIKPDEIMKFHNKSTYFYEQFQLSFESKNIEYIEQIITEFAKFITIFPKSIQFFIVKTIPLLINQSFYYFELPLINQIKNKNSKIFLRLSEILNDCSSLTPNILNILYENNVFKLLKNY